MTGKLVQLRRPEGVVEEMSDEALMAACAVGDTVALGALFDRYHAHVHRFLGRLAGADAADLDDLVQATFIEVRRSAHRFRGASTVKTWIFGVAVNLVRHHARGEIRRHSMLARYAEGPGPAVTRPDAAAQHRELLALADRALAALPHHLRAVYLLCDIEELPGRVAAQALGVREGTLWRRLHEARKRLQAALRESSS